jgi:predicted acylesterase/phospholipase RssA
LQAARATSAAPKFFEPVIVNDFSFHDGGLGANNPSAQAWAEMRDVFQEGHDDISGIVSCFISIGCGKTDIPIVDKSLYGFLAETLVAIATETDKTAESFETDHEQLFEAERCFRFNVEQGLQGVGLEEYKQLKKVMNATEEYLRHRQIERHISATVGRLCQKQCNVDFA